MKKSLWFLSVISVLTLLLGCGNNNVEVIEDASLDDVSFPEDKKEGDTRPSTATLPTDGSDAIGALDLTDTLSYYSNNDLHDLPGQWNGYGVHYPSIFKYNHLYYLYVSTPDSNVGIRAYKSKDLFNWSLCDEAGYPLGYITKARETFAAKAPRVIFHNDAFYLYFNSPSGYHLFKSSNPAGPFVYDSSMNYASTYNGYIFKAPNEKMFFISGGEKEVVIYEMNDINEIDYNSEAFVKSTSIGEYYGNTLRCDAPSIVSTGDYLYLTYSQLVDSYSSYRSSFVFASEPDYSSSYALANSFYSSNQGPIMLATNQMDGDIGLGDLSIVEGPDMVSYYALYTSLNGVNTRRVNISPINVLNANIGFAHRESNSPINILYNNTLIDDKYSERVLTSVALEKKFTAQLNFSDLDKVYFGYKSSNNNYSITFKDGVASLDLLENGLVKSVGSVSYLGHQHEIKIRSSETLSVYLDGVALCEHLSVDNKVVGRLGYQKNNDSIIENVKYINCDFIDAQRISYKQAESNISSALYIPSLSSINNSEPVKIIENDNNLNYFSYLSMKQYHDYARWVVDVMEDGRYGLEMTFNASFGLFGSSLGLRVGKDNPEYIYQASHISDSGYIRTLTAEFDVKAGVNEVLVENLSNGELRLVSIRLVRLSESAPEFSDPLNNYASKGVHYETDFLLNDQYECHQTYEGARSFAYVGDNTISDFELNIEVAFSNSLLISGYVNIGFRCNHFASSRLDNDSSAVGYFLEISQYQTKLVKRNYGFDKTLGVMNLANAINEFQEYKISMVGNQITVYRGELRVFSVIDDYAFSSGHLGFGAYDTVGLIRNISVHKAA